jgi:hypothetical protein
MLLSLVMSITIFIKYNTLIILPVVLVVFILGFIGLPKIDRNKKIILFCLTLLVPLSILSTYMFFNVKNYGTALPANYEIYTNPLAIQLKDDVKVSFFNFKPWETIATPILAPENLSSFWTIIYSGMWFDTEPKFLQFMDSNTVWWYQYFSWLNRQEIFPGANHSMSNVTILEGSTLITLGLFPLLLGIYGFINYYINSSGQHNWIETTKMSIFHVLFIGNAAGIIAVTSRLPVYSHMKASFFLVSLPAFAIYLSLGVMACENRQALKWAIIIIFGALFTMVFWHILHILSFF